MSKRENDPTPTRKFWEHFGPLLMLLILVLFTMVMPQFLERAEEARKAKAVEQMKEITRALEIYKADNGNYPSTEQGLHALVEKPIGQPMPRNWRQYLQSIPRDPWKNNYIYRCPGAAHGRMGDAEREKCGGRYSYHDLICCGPDGVASEDDIVSWNMPE
jgi:general secretion pathway protein G